MINLESGWTCTGSSSKCVTTCGDSLIAGKENCDDGNNKSGDGCDCNCKVETGYTCTVGNPTCKDTCEQTIKTGSLSDCQAFAKQFDNTCISSCNSLTPVPSITKHCNACGSCNG